MCEEFNKQLQELFSKILLIQKVKITPETITFKPDENSIPLVFGNASLIKIVDSMLCLQFDDQHEYQKIYDHYNPIAPNQVSSLWDRLIETSREVSIVESFKFISQRCSWCEKDDIDYVMYISSQKPMHVFFHEHCFNFCIYDFLLDPDNSIYYYDRYKR